MDASATTKKIIYYAYTYNFPATPQLLFVRDYKIPAWPS